MREMKVSYRLYFVILIDKINIYRQKFFSLKKYFFNVHYFHDTEPTIFQQQTGNQTAGLVLCVIASTPLQYIHKV